MNSNSKILVTGGAGFIGSHIADSLDADGANVICVDNLSGGDYANIANFRELRNRQGLLVGDCSDRYFMDLVFSLQGIDTLVYCAANAREGASQFQPASVTRNNLTGYVECLSAAIRYGVKNVILFSSMSVYGKSEPPFSEDMPRSPVDVYGCNKAAMEHVTEILASVHGFNYSIIRPHNVFGERQRMADVFRNVVAIFMNRILRNEPLFIYGDGTQRRAFSYIEDSLPCFLEVIRNCEKYNGEIFNIGGIEHITVNELASICKAVMGVGQDYPIDYLPSRPLEVHQAFSTHQKSVEILGYKETVGWQRGVYLMAKWCREVGSCEWQNNEPLEIITDKTPTPWLNQK